MGPRDGLDALDGPQRWSGCFRRGKYVLPQPRIIPCYFGCPACNL